MEKYKFDISPSGLTGNRALQLGKTLHERMKEGGWTGEFWVEGQDMYIRCIRTGWTIREIVPDKSKTLSTLADEVADTICDKNTRDAFKRFADLLIEKVEKKT